MHNGSGVAAPAQEQEFLLAQLTAIAAARIEPRRQAVFRNFLRHYYEMASLETLRHRTPEDLFETAFQHWQLAEERTAGQARVRVGPPRDPAGAGSRALAVIQTAVDDMPFVVDSIAIAVRELGASIDWAVHPVLRMRRDGKGRIQEVMGAAAEEMPAESLVHMEFDALASDAQYAALEQRVTAVLADLRTVVDDFGPMCERLHAAADLLQRPPPGARAEDFAEGREFLLWLASHFTFLGFAESRVEDGREGAARSRANSESGLGLLRPGGRFADAQEFMAPQEELDKYASSTRLVVVTKASIRSPIHHPEYMDVISVRRFGEDGTPAGTWRFVGLFSSDVYTERPRNIPLVRRKAEYVMRRSRLPENSHSGKNLREILHQLPRDELFQSSEEELFSMCAGIRALRERHQLRLFMRRDRYGRFYSCLVYLPRDRYSREMRDRIAAELMEVCSGQSIDRHVDFFRGGFARIHYIVRTPPGTRIPLEPVDVEQRLIAATRSWRDQLREVLLKVPRSDSALIAASYAEAFPLSYAEATAPLEAAADVQYLAQLSEAQPLLPRLLIQDESHGPGTGSLKLYSLRRPIALSDVLPTLENFGLRVLRQEPTEIQPREREGAWIQEFVLADSATGPAPNAEQRHAFESAFLKVWTREIENDGLNRLVLAAGLEWRQVICLRTLLRYLLQTGLPYSQAYIEQLLADHAQIARLLVRLFEARFEPYTDDAKRVSEELKVGQELDAALDKVVTLDGDRVLRAFLSVVRAALRTNFYQTRDDGSPKHYVSIKLDPRKVPELPRPLPMFEIFVYAPEVEGIHLRGGKVARGGLRWSDRPQDFRTEVLGLMKAQMVKNAIIVPVGAKGGFVVKRGDPTQREEWVRTGVECYKTFVRGLLDLTDNRVGDAVVPPPNVVRHDDDDPYLVVAADKGTATFSDIANGLAAEYGYWMGDAFASGGSAGYDHKKMGITARGAWESVKRHFRELGKDIQNEEFTVVGIGDMSGDVFGNGMLLSRKIRLIAAFDHRHIVIDPNPDAERSYLERERLFGLPRSSWEDYNRDLLSTGGGIYSRSLKVIKLSSEAQKVLDVRKSNFTPPELINVILKAPVELLWNGGIGTYVKASDQGHEDVGDRANDAVRVNARDLRCKVIGEGGNLGVTQLARIEFSLNGGRINTDAIDNAGGVHSSDREVNIKIPLNELMAGGRLTRKERDPLLGAMTDEVARAVLRDNYVQSAAISLLEQTAAQRLEEHGDFIRMLERQGRLDRAVEVLPDEEGMKERRAAGRGLTRPELAVLVAYGKMSLYEALLANSVPDDPFFTRDLLGYFPPRLVDGYREPLQRHRLRREIIATILSNAVVNRMGFSFAYRLADDIGVDVAEVVNAYATAHEIFGGDDYWQSVEALDNKVAAAAQYKLFTGAIGLMKHVTSWLINARLAHEPVARAIELFKKPVAEIEKLLPGVMAPTYREDWDRIRDGMLQQGVPPAYAAKLANTKAMGSALDIAQLSADNKVSIAEAAALYFLVGERFRMHWLVGAIVNLQVQNRWQALARTNLREDAYRLHRRLTNRILQHHGKTPEARMESWIAANERRVGFALKRLQDLQAAGTSDFMGLAVAVREVRKLRSL